MRIDRGLARKLAALLLLGGSAADAQDLPAEPFLDDGFTFFEADNTMQQVNGQREGFWSLISHLRAWGQDIPRHSAFRVVVEGPDGQDAAVYRLEGQPTAGPDQNVVALSLVNLHDRSQKLQLEGSVPVKVYFIDGGTNAESLLKRYLLNVRKVGRVRGTPANPQPDAPQYYISRHGDVPASIIHRRWSNAGPYVWDNGGDKYDVNVVEILFSHSPEVFDNPAHASHLRLRVNGEPVDLRQDAVHGWSPSQRQYSAEQVTAPPAGTGPMVKERVQFRQYYIVPPITWTAPGAEKADPNWVKLNDHPGQWELTWMDGTTPLRVWRFGVNADGTIAQHPEEAGDLRFAPQAFMPDATLIETAIPDGGTPIDARLDPTEVQAGGFYGHAWQSAEMKAAAAAIPARNIFASISAAARFASASGRH